MNDVSLYELLGGYNTFVNLGIHIDPIYITRIEDKNGNVIQNFIPVRKQAINEATAFEMVYMLMGGVEEAGGNSVTLNEELKLDNEIGAKTAVHPMTLRMAGTLESRVILFRAPGLGVMSAASAIVIGYWDKVVERRGLFGKNTC